jgi:hypothetical protein
MSWPAVIITAWFAVSLIFAAGYILGRAWGKGTLMTTTIRILQLDKHGNVWREFRLHADSKTEAEFVLDRIRLAYNMERTRVLVNGKEAR